MKALHFLFLLFLLNSRVPGFAQRKHIQFEHIGTAEGLSQSDVTCIFQDSRGFMWFGTYDGLDKYDGYEFTVYKYNADDRNSLSNSAIMDITEDDDDNLWIATWGGGLNKFDLKKGKFTRYQFNAKDPSGIGKDYISKLLMDREGNLWIGTEGGGLNMFDKKNNKFIHYVYDKNDPKSLSDNHVKDIIEDDRHNLWVCTIYGGLNLFDEKTKTFRRFQHDDKNTMSISSNNVSAVFIDTQNRLWVGTGDGGMNFFNREKEEFIHFKTDPHSSNSLTTNVITAINEDEEGDLWIGTENAGLSIFNTSTGTFDNHLQDDADNASLNNNTIISFFKDAKGDMWIGTFSGGINFVSRDANKFIHYRHSSSPSSLSDNNVLSIFEDSKQNLWIGTDGGGLNLFDVGKGTFTIYKHDPRNENSLCGNHILTIFEDSDNNLWIGTWGDGITVFNKEKNTFRHFGYDSSNLKGLPNPNVWSICEDSDKNIWIGTYGGGLCQYDRKTGHFINYRNLAANPTGLSSDFINIVYEDKKGNLWLGGNGSGLDLFNKKTKTFTHFAHDDSKNSISNNDILSITEDGDGNLWIGTSLGLNRMDGKTGKFTNYSIKDGLPGNTIAGLLFDDKRELWISTYNGLSRFNSTTGIFKNFDINDGLQSNEFKLKSCWKSHSGRMYFGGTNGFNGFYPGNIHEKKYEPPLVFTDFRIFNKEVPIGEKTDDKSFLKQSITDTKELVLPYDQSVITFDFASLNYVLQNKKQYSYMLENFDKNWNDIAIKHTATYTNLDPGKYTFKVRGWNNQGGWSSNTATLRLIITPPFWLTWWFKILVFASIIGGAILFYRFRMNIVEAQKRKLQHKVNEQTKQLIESTKEEQRARREAEQANIELEIKSREMEQFTYIASHDLQEPLRTTSSFVKLLQKQYEGKLDEKGDKYVTYILEASERMKLLIRNLLDFSQIGNKKVLEPVDCNKILHNVLADLGIAISEAGAIIKHEPLPVINGYATELKQLFQNLVTNAIKFRKKDIPPVINISVQKNEGYWKFAFEDNGIGIEGVDSEKIFAIFQRLHTRAEYEGSGIGLSYCKKIVELHKGKIWVRSTPGEGSIFYFTLSAMQTNVIQQQ